MSIATGILGTNSKKALFPLSWEKALCMTDWGSMCNLLWSDDCCADIASIHYPGSSNEQLRKDAVKCDWVRFTNVWQLVGAHQWSLMGKNPLIILCNPHFYPDKGIFHHGYVHYFGCIWITYKPIECASWCCSLIKCLNVDSEPTFFLFYFFLREDQQIAEN